MTRPKLMEACHLSHREKSPTANQPGFMEAQNQIASCVQVPGGSGPPAPPGTDFQSGWGTSLGLALTVRERGTQMHEGQKDGLAGPFQPASTKRGALERKTVQTRKQSVS